MRFVYLLSSEFSYDKLICDDAGPRFADEYGWPWCRLKDAGDIAGGLDAVIVDTRFPDAELGALDRFLQGFRGKVLLRITDPFEQVVKHHWFRYVRERLDHPGHHVMLTYSPAGATALLMMDARRSRFVFAPYVYDPERELPLSHAGRSGKVLLSGSLKRSLYPLRRAFQRARRLWPPLRFQSDVLAHPGYPDVPGRPGPAHDVIGTRYIERLARYRFALACSTVARTELLKYRELAYAGTVPLGDMPASLIDCPAEAYVKWDGGAMALTRRLRAITPEDSEYMAGAFRAFIRERRNAARMRAWVAEQMAAL